MPEGFNKCRQAGGKVVTKKLKNNRYLHICYDKEGKAHTGEIKTKKKETSRNKKTRQHREHKQVNNAKRLDESLKQLQEFYNDRRA